MDIIDELRNGPSYTLNSDEKLLRQRAADEIDMLRHQCAELEALIRRDRSKTASRRAA